MTATTIQEPTASGPTKISDLVKPTRQRIKAANDNYVVNSDRAHVMLDAPIQRLHRAGRISSTQLEAGIRLYADWYAAGLAPLGAIDYERAVVDGKSPKGESDYRVGALSRYNDACKSLPLAISQAVDSIVIMEVSAEDFGRKVGHNNAPQARAVAVDRLMIGLDILVKFYGLG